MFVDSTGNELCTIVIIGGGVVAVAAVVAVCSYFNNDRDAGSAANDGVGVGGYGGPSRSGGLAGGGQVGVQEVGAVAPYGYHLHADVRYSFDQDDEAGSYGGGIEQGGTPRVFVNGEARKSFMSNR